MVVVDRYSGWPIVQQSRDGSSGLVKCLREIFVTYGIADELSSDGGPEFTAEETQQLLSNWGVHHRLSSVALAHSNGRAELGVKTCKRMLMDNTGPNGEINLDKFQRGILQYRNTPDRDTGLSPAQMIFGRPIKDFIPILPGSYRPHNTWIETSRAREEAMRARIVRNAERLPEHTVRLQPLKVGDRVFIQNQTGNHPLRWDRTGLVIEVKQFDHYAVKVDGSGRVTLRNRKFLRQFDKIVVDIPGTTRGLHSTVTVLPDLLQPVRTGGGREMYNVVNSIITDRKMYRCIFKVSFYFRGSLYEINVLLTLFLQIEVSILRTSSASSDDKNSRCMLPRAVLKATANFFIG